MRNGVKLFGVCVAVVVAACTREQRGTADSAAGTAVDVARAELSVINVDMGKHVDVEKKITDGSDVFAPADTIFASVHTSGTAKPGQLTAQWTFPDNSVVDQKGDSSIADGMGRSVFFITKPGGLAKGKYTFRAIVDGREVRSKEVTVQ